MSRSEEANQMAFEIMAMDAASTVPWKRGLPPGAYYEGMTDDYEVYFSPGGVKWHRKRSDEDADTHHRLTAEIIRLRAPEEESAPC